MLKITITAVLIAFSGASYAQKAKPVEPVKAAIATADVVPMKATKVELKNRLTLERFEGYSVKTHLSASIILNSNSKLNREWFVLTDAESPLAISGPAGIDVDYKSGQGYASGNYQYFLRCKLIPKEPITAFEIRVHVLDVFGKLLRTLSATELMDMNSDSGYNANWRIWAENEASEAFASIAYVAQVRTASGQVYEADRTAVFDHMRKIARKITEADLEPKKPNAEGK